MKRLLVGMSVAVVSVAFGLGCTTGETDTTDTGGAGGGAAQPATYAGTYEVPVPPELEAAATYTVAEINWTVANGVATLEYDLPLGLVGKKVRVRFSGPVDGATATLSGPPGTADCTLEAGAVSCLETMEGLLPLDSDYAVIESTAASEYAGPVADRIDVAKQFQGDPIGIVHIDLTKPVVTDDPPGTETH
ncbi:MAG: hypothetical protein U0271_10305 [Polyangiaceae bacterium]